MVTGACRRVQMRGKADAHGSMTTCGRCGMDHPLVARRELNGSQKKTVDKVLHPWRYAERRRRDPLLKGLWLKQP